MINEAEINLLNEQIKKLNARKIEYQRISKEIDEAMSDFNDMKIGIIRAQGYLLESDSSEIIMKKVAEMDEDIRNVKDTILSLEEMKIEIEKETQFIDNMIIEKQNKIRQLN